MKILTLSVERSREIDRHTIEEFGFPSFLLMENAGRELCHHIETLLEKLPRLTWVSFFCGTGNNGGDGFVAARHLQMKHANVHVYLMGDSSLLKGDAKANYSFLKKLNIEVLPYSEFARHRDTLYQRVPLLLVDAMLGTGAKGLLKEPYRQAVLTLNELKKYHNSKVMIVAADLPTGLDGDEGPVQEPILRADVTVAFGCLKPGLLKAEAKPYVGKIEVADIGIPETVLRSFGS